MKLIRSIVLAASLSLAVVAPQAVVAPPQAEAAILKDVYNRTSSGVLAYNGPTRFTIPAYGSASTVTRIVVPTNWAFTVRITNKATGARQDRTVYGATSIYLGSQDSIEVLASWIYR